MSTPLLGLTGIIYLIVSLSEWRAGHIGLSIAFLGYAFSNVGLIMATIR
jgi:hypothetical protein